DVQALVQRLEGELRLMSGSGEARSGTATRASDTMEVDVVRHLARGVILQMKLDRVSLPHADEAAGHCAAERPERVSHTLADFFIDLDDFQIDDDLGRMCAIGWWRNVRRTGQHGANRFAL